MTLSFRDPLLELGVSRETISALERLEALVQRWTATINLISRATLPELWTRHILDSAQLFQLAPPASLRWVDLGSGAGFPGLVIAIIARELLPELRVSLIESDTRKATFLRQAVRDLGLSCRVIHQRIELAESQHADVLSARALTSLAGLLSYAERHLSDGGVAIFPKGERRKDEIAEARATWIFDADSIASMTDEHAAILVIRNCRRANHP